MFQSLESAIELRNRKDYEASSKQLALLLQQFPEDANVNYQYAWSLDLLGHETEAVPYYEKAIELGLSEEDLQGAYIGLGSTYRTIGQYEKSQTVFQNAVERFPQNKAMQVFQALTMYNLGQHEQAMNALLTVILQTTNAEEIKKYARALEFYKDHLEEVWT